MTSNRCAICKNETNKYLCYVCSNKKSVRRKGRISRGICRDCSNKIEIGSYRCYDCNRKKSEYRRNLRIKVYEHYGNACTCCGETTKEFLTIDHVNNDGAVERKLGLSGITLLRKIIREGYPNRYQILCFNCNIAKAICSDGCPHKKFNSKSNEAI